MSTVANGRKFDREIHFDPRSLAYTVPKQLEFATIHSQSWACYAHLDQGNVGHCVGFGNAAELAARPAIVREVDNDFGHNLFFAAQAIDREEGRFYDDGATCLAGAKAMRRHGYISGYAWATTIGELLQGLMHGPIVMGTWWKSTMFDVDAHGYVDISGDNVGGHCWLVRSYSTSTRRVRARQSWGAWGIDGTGDFFVHLDDLEALLLEDGEALVYRGRDTTGDL